MTGWDTHSGIRERLALLATLDPHALLPTFWGYDPRKDSWFYTGLDPLQTRRQVAVQQEGSKSLEIILHKWKIDRFTAMAMIGYPDIERA